MLFCISLDGYAFNQIARHRSPAAVIQPGGPGVVAQRIAFVQEKDDLYAEATAAPGATVVTRIEVVEQKEEKAGPAKP